METFEDWCNDNGTLEGETCIIEHDVLFGDVTSEYTLTSRDFTVDAARWNGDRVHLSIDRADIESIEYTGAQIRVESEDGYFQSWH
jgi:hypothetical protein